MSQDRFSLRYLMAQASLSHLYYTLEHKLSITRVSQFVKIGRQDLYSMGLNCHQIKTLFYLAHKILSDKSEVPCGIYLIDPKKLDYSTIIGQGRFGLVFEGFLSPSTKVAVKSFHSDDLNINIYLSLEHPNLVKHIGITLSPLTLVSLFFPGTSLRSWLDLQTRVPTLLALYYIRQLLDGMVFLHLNGIVHGLLSSHQVIINRSNLKISDYSLSPHFHNRPAWVSPELLPDGTPTFSSDVWSFSVILWELFSPGSLPWPGLSLSELVSAHQQGTLPKPESCPRPLETMLRRIWAASPFNRPSFESLRLDFADINLETVRLLCDYGIFLADDRAVVLDWSDSLEWKAQNMRTLEVGFVRASCVKAVTRRWHVGGFEGIVPGSFRHVAHIGADGSGWGFPGSERKVVWFGNKSHHYQAMNDSDEDC